MSGAVTGINRTASLTPIHSFVKFLRIFTLERLNIESLCSQEAKVMHCVINVSRETGVRIILGIGSWLKRVDGGSINSAFIGFCNLCRMLNVLDIQIFQKIFIFEM